MVKRAAWLKVFFNFGITISISFSWNRRRSEAKSKAAGGLSEKEFKVGRDLIEEETSQENRVKTEIYMYYAKSVGMTLAILSVLFYAMFQTFTVGANLWLSVWSEDEEAATNTAKRNLYLGVYGTLGFLQVIPGLFCSFFAQMI